uniref:Uncharacterized protein n=1 Tax=Spongospora subterranea TaxID=70186 RepID=A0A0H5RUA3_9EUKA|eukprot:CRZ12299.1 hypothetical protein [Spongospora subterranea]
MSLVIASSSDSSPDPCPFAIPYIAQHHRRRQRQPFQTSPTQFGLRRTVDGTADGIGSWRPTAPEYRSPHRTCSAASRDPATVLGRSPPPSGALRIPSSRPVCVFLSTSLPVNPIAVPKSPRMCLAPS